MDKQNENNSVARYLVDWLGRHLESEDESILTWNIVRDIARRSLIRGWRAYLVGGAVRDIALTHGAKIPRDIDIVFAKASIEDVDREFSDFAFIRKTSFGGSRLRRNGVLVDFWSLDHSYSYDLDRQPTISDIPKYAFLNIEAVAVEISLRKLSESDVFECGFSEGINTKTLEINFEPNPFPEVSILRAFRSAIGLNLLVGRTLVSYIQARSWNVERLLSEQKRHYDDDFFAKDQIEEILYLIGSVKPSTARFDLNAELRKDRSFSAIISKLNFANKP
jgi:hypothetical protein